MIARHNISYVHGVSDEPLIYQTIGDALDEATSRWPDNEALVSCHQNIRWTYKELRQGSDEFAAGLIALGLKPGERVGIWSPNCAEWLLTQYATAKAGLILVNINPAYRLSELEYALNKVSARALITAATFKTSNYLDMVRTLLDAAKLPKLELVIRLGAERSAGMLNFDDVPARATGASRAAVSALKSQLQPDDAINIQFTSGTTGAPKGATLTHFNILNNGRNVTRAQNFTERDRLCAPVPLYHCFGMVMANLGCLTHGATVVYPAEAFEPGAVLRAVEAERCTALYGVPTMFVAELEHPAFDTFDLTSLRTGVMAGAPCPIEVMKKVVARMHMRDVTICYGMTETSPVSFQSRSDDPLEKRVSTVGRIHPHVEVKVVDENGRTVALGEKGEILTRGYSVMLGYWDDKEKTREAIDAAGWMHTGDLATLSQDGYCNIVGRVKDMVIRGGENIYPREVEEFLYRHPKIKDVSVFDVPDAKYGEELCAWIEVRAGERLGEDEVRAFCKGQIAHYKIPRYVRFVDAFPMTVTGKIQKFVMRAAMVKELDIQEQKTA